LEEGKHFKEMSKQAEKGITLPGNSTTSAKWSQKKTKKTESKNKKAFATLTLARKERNKFKYATESEERTTIQRTTSGIRVLPETRAFNGNKFQNVENTHGFEMLNLCYEEGDDDCLSMISMNSRSSSAATDFPEEVKLENDNDELLSLENVNIDNVGWMRTAAAESRQSDLTLDGISVDNGSPRKQATQLHVENVSNDDKAKKYDFDSSSVAAQAEAEGSRKEPENKSSKVKTAWQLNEKFLLTADFPAEVWEEKLNRKATNARRKSSDLLNASFPPLSLVPGLRRSSFPSSALKFSTATRELPSLSGRQCKVQLPSSFPGVPPPLSASDSESESSAEEKPNHLFRDKEQFVRTFDQNMQKNHLEVPSKRTKNLRNSSSRSSPISSTSPSPMTSTETLAIRAASTEYLAARVVTQLNSAFKETTIESNDKVTARENCVTPNLMPRRYSALSFRPNTSGYLDEQRNSLVLPSVHNECSKSLPNLTDDKSKRMFVTFDQHFPQASVVDLKGKGDLAQRCRVINRRLSSEDAIVKAMLDTKIKKKSMVKKWVISSTQCT